jgi:hypothetical protein
VTAANWLILIGGALQVAGVVVTSIGATRTWNEFSPDERLFAEAIRRVQSLASSIYIRLRSLVGKPVPARMSSMGAEPMIRTGGRGNLTKNYAAIDTDSDVLDILHDLDRRTRELQDEANRISSQLFKTLPELRQRLTNIEKQLTESIARLEHRDRQVATGGIKSILGGLALVAFGVVVQSVSIFF